MTPIIALIVNSALALGLVGALALVVRPAHRVQVSLGRETLHPSQPLSPAIVLAERDEENALARVA